MVRPIGILGGMGPEATVLLMQKIIAATPARDDADHLPLIVDLNPQVPSRIRHLIERTGPDPAPVLAAMARRLQAAGCAALAMPCNTAHAYAGAIRAAVTIPLIDMVALSVERAAALAGPGGRVGLLASPAVRRTGLFDAPMAAAGLTPVYPDDQDSLLAAIRLIKAEGACPAARQHLLRASQLLHEAGAQVQVVACTEFSLIPDAVVPEARTFDTLDQLVSGIIAFAAADGAGQDKTEVRSAPHNIGARAPTQQGETT